MSLKIGDLIPEFTLKDIDNNDFYSRSLIGKQPFVMYFYPKDFTPGCTKEACSFRDHYEEFKDLGAEVIGISSDSEKMHEKFARNYKLPFILLSDKKKTVRKLFGIPANLFGLLPGRETYVFDKNGKVVMVFNSMSAIKHIDKALDILKQLK
ncbi:redoxin domain-containing protein [Flavobacteriaceae bacterium R38]|nr:redoxin domain-containing protein [Flavobacteriaceae bacterium R38]